MNGPSLRGCGASMGKNAQKNGSSCPPPPLKIDPSKLNHLRSLNVDIFLNASNVTMQLDFMKNFTDYVKENEAPNEHVEFVIIVFLESPLKHPLKIASSKMLISIEKREIASLTYAKLQFIIKSANINNVQSLNDVCNSISSCIELFPLNIYATKEFIVDTLDFLKNILQKHIEILSSKSLLSPTKKTEYYSFIHNASRTMISIIQKINYKGIIKESWLEEIFNVCEYFINHDELPTDTKGNCSIILIISLNIRKGSNTWVKVLENIFTDNADSKPIFQIKNSDIVKMVISSAILNIADINELCSEMIDDLPALVFICNNLMKLTSISSLNSVIILGSARSIALISKSIFKANDEISVKIAHILLDFIWVHLDYYVDSVRHLTIQILANIVKLALVLDSKGNRSLSSTLIKTIVDVPDARSINFKALIRLGSEYNCSYLLQKNDNLPSYMLSNIDNCADSANITSAFEVLMTKHRQEVFIQVFFSTWIDPILNKLSLFESSVSDSSLTSSILSGILLKAVKLDPQILPLLIPILNEDFSDLNDGKIKSTLVCLNVARKYGYLDLKISTDKMWKDVVPFDLLHIAILHQNAEIRLLAFSLLIESHKSTEYFDYSEFQLIKKFYQYNINVKSPNIHQKILSITKKLFQRWQCGYLKCTKVTTNEDNSSLLQINENYVKFINDICILCLRNIFPDANFTRKNISMQILIMCQEICNKNKFENGFWEKDQVSLLFEYLNDSYECNKQLALSLLILCPFEHDLFYHENTWVEAFKAVILRASSVKPTECMSSAYKMELLINKHPHNVLTLYKQLGLEDIVSEAKIPYLNHHNTIKLLLNILEKEKNVAQKSILLAAANGPMYGLLYCIRHILGKVDMNLISQHRCWSELIKEIIRLSFDISEAVKLIVNNSSPEGHLPMDFNAGSLHIEKNGVQLEGGKSVTAQMVLLCAWRSIKEVSLILGDISYQSVIMKDTLETDDEQNILLNSTITKQQMLDIGDHFITLLSETKHRGAFEQAYVGFSKLCLRLWKCNSIELHDLPNVWLSDLIAAISSGNSDNSKLCATRRSAGVPFIIQALVTTELQTNNSPTSFQMCITKLLNLSLVNVNEDTRLIETKVHCLNILRTLYRHTALGEHVNQYVTEGLIISINGFDGVTWAERNASTLLFSSLITRIFGVQRTKNSDQLSIRNKMTGRIFFLRYPKLYDFLLNSLKLATECQKDYSLRPSLYPILLLLSRLYPSSLEGTDSNLQLIAFIPYLVWCAGNCVLKIRQLAAKAIVPLISQEWYFKHIMEMLKLTENKNHKHNFKHGILLQLIKLLQHLPDNLTLDELNLKCLANTLETVYGFIIQTSHICFPVSCAYLKVTYLCLKRFPEIIKLNLNFFQTLKSTLFKDLDFKCDIPIGMDEFYVEILNLKLILILLMDGDRVPEIFSAISQNMTHQCRAVIQRNMNYILCLYCNDKHEEIEEKFDISHSEKSFVSQLSSSEISKILNCFNSSLHFKEKMFFILKDSVNLEDREKSLIILSYVPDTIYGIITCSKSSSNDEILENLISCFESEHEQINYIYLRILNIYLTENFDKSFGINDIFNHNNIKKLLTILKDCINEQQKNMSIDIILNHWHLFKWNSEEINEKYFELILLQWSIIVKLSRDVNEIIASKMHKLSKVILSGNINKFKISQNLWRDNCRSMTMNENGAIEVFLNYLAKLMLGKSFEHSIAALVILALGESNLYEFPLDEQLVFDKIEDYESLEECELTMICLGLVEKIINDESITKPKREIILENPILSKWCNSSNSSLNKLFDCVKNENMTCETLQNYTNDIADFKIRKIFMFFNEK